MDTPQARTALDYETETVDANDDPFTDLDEYESDLTTLSTTVREHVYENGRRYHAFHAGQYLLPNDEQEQKHLGMMHHLCNLMLGGRLHLVELPQNLHRVLDVGTGTGLWAAAMADEHPEATVLGVDLSPIQIPFIPLNCDFEVDNVEEDWIWAPFDLIHSRNIAQGIRDWKKYIRQIFDHLNPGGVVQLVEAEGHFYSDDGTLPATGQIENYNAAFKIAMQFAGMQVVEGAGLENLLRNAGFIDVRISAKKVPIGTWPENPWNKELGRLALEIAEVGLRSYSAALFTRNLPITPEQVENICAGAYEELQNPDVHCYFRYWYVEGRKPEA